MSAGDGAASRRFATTQWTIVLSAGRGGPEALEELCVAYWEPLYWHARRLGHDEDGARDLIQSFLARLIERRGVGLADPARGRFRTFLLTALRRFAINEWKRESAARRGGGRRTFSLDFAAAESGFAAEPSHDLSPDALFRRRWAEQVLEQALAALEERQRSRGRAELYAALAPYLSFTDDRAGYAAVAGRFGTTPAALKMAIRRLRSELGELIRERIRETVCGEVDVDEELRELMAALRP